MQAPTSVPTRQLTLSRRGRQTAVGVPATLAGSPTRHARLLQFLQAEGWAVQSLGAATGGDAATPAQLHAAEMLFVRDGLGPLRRKLGVPVPEKVAAKLLGIGVLALHQRSQELFGQPWAAFLEHAAPVVAPPARAETPAPPAALAARTPPPVAAPLAPAPAPARPEPLFSMPFSLFPPLDAPSLDAAIHLPGPLAPPPLIALGGAPPAGMVDLGALMGDGGAGGAWASRPQPSTADFLTACGDDDTFLPTPTLGQSALAPLPPFAPRPEAPAPRSPSPCLAACGGSRPWAGCGGCGGAAACATFSTCLLATNGPADALEFDTGALLALEPRQPRAPADDDGYEWLRDPLLDAAPLLGDADDALLGL